MRAASEGSSLDQVREVKVFESEVKLMAASHSFTSCGRVISIRVTEAPRSRCFLSSWRFDNEVKISAVIHLGHIMAEETVSEG